MQNTYLHSLTYIWSRGGPFVRPDDWLAIAHADHGLDGKGVTRSHYPIVNVITIMQHAWIVMKHAVNTAQKHNTT